MAWTLVAHAHPYIISIQPIGNVVRQECAGTCAWVQDIGTAEDGESFATFGTAHPWPPEAGQRNGF
jgi:hypothetical protein